MKIGIIGSYSFVSKMKEIGDQLEEVGHLVSYAPSLHSFMNLSSEDLESKKEAYDGGFIMESWNAFKDVDAILVVNITKRGIDNYLGGSTLIEMALAYVKGKKIFLYNPIPEIQYYYDEILKMKPIIIKGDLSLIKE